MRALVPVTFGAAVVAVALFPIAALAQSDTPSDTKSRMQQLESKVLDSVTPVGPVPASDHSRILLG